MEQLKQEQTAAEEVNAELHSLSEQEMSRVSFSSANASLENDDQALDTTQALTQEQLIAKMADKRAYNIQLLSKDDFDFSSEGANAKKNEFYTQYADILKSVMVVQGKDGSIPFDQNNANHRTALNNGRVTIKTDILPKALQKNSYTGLEGAVQLIKDLKRNQLEGEINKGFEEKGLEVAFEAPKNLTLPGLEKLKDFFVSTYLSSCPETIWNITKKRIHENNMKILAAGFESSTNKSFTFEEQETKAKNPGTAAPEDPLVEYYNKKVDKQIIDGKLVLQDIDPEFQSSPEKKRGLLNVDRDKNCYAHYFTKIGK